MHRFHFTAFQSSGERELSVWIDVQEDIAELHKDACEAFFCKSGFSSGSLANAALKFDSEMT